MGWLLLLSLTLALALASSVQLTRRAELTRLAQNITAKDDAKTKGSHQARLQHPHVDLSRCIGCGTCIQACPENGVLDLIHGQAVVIHGARCVGHGLCAKACPVGAIDLTLGDLTGRTDIPALNEQFEVCGMPGLFLAGEVTGYALIRTAITHGTAVVDEVAKRLQPVAAAPPSQNSGHLLDLCIVGAGPAGIAASLQAKSKGLSFATLEQASLGGTVANYPRRKLLTTQPVILPLHGKLKQASYSKEELMQLWSELAAQHELPVITGAEFIGLTKHNDGHFLVKTKTGAYESRFVCLALGRRGTPRKLNVPGEELPKVAYHLIDAQSYRNRKILVVGGGDSAIEAAIGLAEQPGNNVTISYRKSAFSRLKARNEARVDQAIERGLIRCVFNSQVREIEEKVVHLGVRSESEVVVQTVANDDVFIMVGGTPPFALLESSGVSFDPADRKLPPPLVEQGTGFLMAVIVAWALCVMVLVWVLSFQRYYLAPLIARPLSDLHEHLRPSSTFGLSCGVVSLLLIICNLAYLLRRKWLRGAIPGALTTWMTSHVVTGILAFLLVLVHAAMAPRNTLGGHACLALGVLVITGSIGRYFYAFIPRAANGQELALEDLNSQIAAESTEWERFGRGFGNLAQTEVRSLVAAVKWNESFLSRLLALWNTQSAARQTYLRLLDRGREAGLSQDQLVSLINIAQKAHRTALMSAHYEDLRALLNSWRYFHRWVALLLVLLTTIHILVACSYGGFLR